MSRFEFLSKKEFLKYVEEAGIDKEKINAALEDCIEITAKSQAIIDTLSKTTRHIPEGIQVLTAAATSLSLSRINGEIDEAAMFNESINMLEDLVDRTSPTEALVLLSIASMVLSKEISYDVDQRESCNENCDECAACSKGKAKEKEAEKETSKEADKEVKEEATDTSKIEKMFEGLSKEERAKIIAKYIG